MKIQAVAKNVRISPLKVRLVARELVGMSAQEALQVLQWVPQKSARLLLKTLKSAVANAENNFNVPSEQLTICQAIVDEGITLKRFQPASRGSAHPIRKRSSHIKIVLTSEMASRQNQKR